MSGTSIRVYRDILEKDAAWAEQTRVLAESHGITILNLIGSPGSGKTTLLEKAVAGLRDRLRFAVLEGDVETSRDAERLGALDVIVSQLITGGGCHLSAQMVHEAFRDLPLEALDVVIVENVGNLVCPAAFDIGETAKVAVLSLTEGEDKPVKYPRLFRDARAVVITKTDLLPYIPADLDACLANVRRIHAEAPIFPVSGISGEGVDAWVEWVETLAARR